MTQSPQLNNASAAEAGAQAAARDPKAAARDPKAAAEVYYDGACPLCRAEIAAYRRRADPSVAWRDVSSPEAFAGAAPPPADRATLLARFHARRADGAVVSGARAFFSVWRAMPGLAPVARMIDRQPFIALADAAYWLFLKIRPLWRPQPAVCDESCGAPPRKG